MENVTHQGRHGIRYDRRVTIQPPDLITALRLRLVGDNIEFGGEHFGNLGIQRIDVFCRSLDFGFHATEVSHEILQDNEKTILENRMALFDSVGYLISSDDMTTVIAAEQNDEAEYRDITLIPTGSIVSIETLISSAPV